MKPATLLRLYPRAWREKYGDEFVALLEQTAVGWRQVVDVALAASRERSKELLPGASLDNLVRQVQRGIGLYAFGLACLMAAQWAAPGVPRIDLTLAMNHVGMMEIFLLTAVVSSATERWGLGIFAKSVASFGGSFALSNASLAVSVLLLLLLRLVVPMVGVLVDTRSPGLLAFLMAGQRFGRPSRLAHALKSGPDFPPRPPSIQGLGLSA